MGAIGEKKYTFAAAITALVGLIMARGAQALPFRWYVNASSIRAGVVWIVCGYFMPSQAATGCVGAALSIGIGAVISAHGGTGTSDALIPYRISVDNVSYAHTTHEGVTHNFINTSVLYHDWHHVHAIDQPMNLTVSMLPDGRVHARTVGFSAMDCGDNCPDKNATNQLAARSGSVPSHVQEIVFAWSARKGWSSKTETRLKGAVFGAAYYVTHEPSGAFQFCSSAYLTDGTIAHVGFNFYGDKYTPNIPPAC